MQEIRTRVHLLIVFPPVMHGRANVCTGQVQMNTREAHLKLLLRLLASGFGGKPNTEEIKFNLRQVLGVPEKYKQKRS